VEAGIVKRDALVVCILVAGAFLLALVGFEALRWDGRLAADDARFAATPLSEGLWEEGEALPLTPTKRLLGLEDDLRYRRAVSLYVRSRPGEPTSLNPERETLRGDARRALSGLSKEDPSASRRSQAAMLVALLSLGQGDLFQSAEERLQVLRGGVGNLQIAVALDPDNAEAKRNLELVLTSVGLPPSGATDAGGTSDTGDQAGVGRAGSGY
jgi:hypothetical protein